MVSGLVEKPALHVAFSPSAADNIRKALRAIGCVERVIGCPDDLSVGPIDRPDIRSRATWFADELGFAFDDACREADQFWMDTATPHGSPVAWVCLNDATDYAGLLEFVWRMAESPFQIIDVGNVTLPRRASGRRRLPSLGIMTPNQIIRPICQPVEHVSRRPREPNTAASGSGCGSKTRHSASSTRPACARPPSPISTRRF